MKPIKEGEAEIFTNGVFYNPKMKFCRDLDVLFFSTFKKGEYLDALAATGVRGIRAKLEAGLTSIFNDKDPKAIKVIKKNLKHNQIDAAVYNKDASVLMRERKFWHIDVDPFGSPSQFIDSACYSAKKYLSITATDTAALCGSAVEAGCRKYSAYIEKIQCYPEVGIRVLIGKIAREAVKYKKGIEVLVCWAQEHYYRVHVEIRKSSLSVKDTLKKIGFVFHCPSCLALNWSSMFEVGSVSNLCDFCASKMKLIGPLWIGELHSNELIKKILKARKAEADKVKFLNKIYYEENIPFYYNLHKISAKLNVSCPPISAIMEELKKRGFSASRCRFDGNGIKTNAGIKEIAEILKNY